MTGAGDAEHATHDDGDPGDRRLIDRLERAYAAPDGAVLLGLGPDEEAGVVHEVHDRQMERVAEVHHLRHLLGTGRGQGAARVHRIVGHHADRIPVEPRHSGHERGPILRRDLEE